MSQIGFDSVNPFAKVELKDPAKKQEFDCKVQEALSDGVLTKEEFGKLKEDFITKDGVSFDKVIAGLPSDSEVKASLDSIPDSDKALAPLRARYEKVLPELGKMLGTDIPQKPPEGMFVHIQPDISTIQPMKVEEPPLPAPEKKKPPEGMFVHIQPDISTIQPVIVVDPPLLIKPK
jgi:hypothetical protein